MKTSFAALIFFLSGLASLSQACSLPGLRHEVTFASGNADMETAQVRALAEWYASLRDGPLGIELLWLFARSEEGNIRSMALTQARVSAVAALVRTLGSIAPVPMHLDVKGIVSPRPQTYDEIVVSVIPKCAKTGKCCG